MASIYNFPAHISGNTFNGVQFLFDINAAPADVTDVEMKFVSPLADTKILRPGQGITLIAGGFQVDAQVIDWDPTTYIYNCMITLANGYLKQYVKGKWKITLN